MIAGVTFPKSGVRGASALAPTRRAISSSAFDPYCPDKSTGLKTQLEPIGARHVDVTENDVRSTGSRGDERLGGAACRRDIEAQL